MLDQLRSGLRGIFEKEDNAHGGIIPPGLLEEKFHPGDDDLVLAFPPRNGRGSLANYVSALIVQVSEQIGLEIEGCWFSESGGLVVLSPGTKKKVNVIINCVEGREEALLLLRIL